jgi:tRNA(His) 5'-end guanylyltransferase
MSLGDRMKEYEQTTGSQTLERTKPYIVRIDGHSFSRFTSGFMKPFDELLSESIVRTMTDTLNHFNAVTGYTQSDEITLIFTPTYNSKTEKFNELPFNGRVIKITSLIAAYASVKFNFHLNDLFDQCVEKDKYSDNTVQKIKSFIAHFDARAFSVPCKQEVFNNILWRSRYDCRRNSIHNLARSKFSTKQLHKKHSGQMVQMLQDVGVVYDDMSEAYRFGTFVKREKYTKQVEGNDSVIRTRDRRFYLDMSSYDEKLADLFVDKYYS